MSASALWAATQEYYDTTQLLALTNVRDRTASGVNDTIGVAAAARVIDLWPLYAQTEYDADSPTHVAVGVEAVRALLMRRGGVDPESAQAAWDEVFGTGGTISKVKDTGPRARTVPVSGRRSLDRNGRSMRPWYDPRNTPLGVRPRGYRADGTS